MISGFLPIFSIAFFVPWITLPVSFLLTGTTTAYLLKQSIQTNPALYLCFIFNFLRNKKYQLGIYDCYVEQQSCYSLSGSFLSLHSFWKIFNIFHSNRFVFLSCILQSSVFGTKPCFIKVYVSYDFLLTHINILLSLLFWKNLMWRRIAVATISLAVVNRMAQSIINSLCCKVTWQFATSGIKIKFNSTVCTTTLEHLQTCSSMYSSTISLPPFLSCPLWPSTLFLK